MTKARYIMVGGFLGAGKTTLMLRLGRHLKQQGRRVGLITNDQSFGLVDTTLLSSQGLPVEEITGGCFCCRFNSLLEAADRLSHSAAPDVFLAEPVGSCTDLRAAVAYPLRRMYGENFEIAPLTVLVDPIRALRILGLEAGRSFSPKVLYVYGKQLEEADIIAVNKIDLLASERLERLMDALREAYPHAELLPLSAREGTGFEAWLQRITTGDANNDPAPEVDYDTYADGEALLGWFNATVSLEASEEFDGNEFLFRLAAAMQDRIVQAGGEVAHLKMTLSPDEEGGDIGVVNLVRSDGAPEVAHRLRERLYGGELIVNLRAEADPEAIDEIATETLVRATAAHTGLRSRIEHKESFRPARPSPTYRMVTA
jgi:G3E family GTPase